MNDSMPLDQPQTLSPWRFQGNIDSPQQLHSRMYRWASRRKNPQRTMEEFQQPIQPLSACESQPIVSGMPSNQIPADKRPTLPTRRKIWPHPLSSAGSYSLWHLDLTRILTILHRIGVQFFLWDTHAKERAEDAQLKEIQKLINENQRLIDENQKLIDENQRLSKNLKTAYFATDGEVDHHIELTSSTNCQVLKSTPRSTLIRPTDDTTYPQIILFLNTEDRLRFANIPNGPDTIFQAIDEILYAPSETDKGLA